MSTYLEPSFLLELGAYAVAAAGIRIFKSKYWRTGVLPSAHGTPYVEQPVATVQAAPPTVLGLGQASPLRAPASPRRSPSPILQAEPQLATPVAPQPLHEDNSAATPFPALCCPLPTQAAGEASPGSATDTEMAEADAGAVVPAEFAAKEQAAEEISPDGLAVNGIATQPPAPATALELEEVGPDAIKLDFKAYNTVADMLTQSTDEPKHASDPCSRARSENTKDHLMGADSIIQRETCGSADIEAPSHTPGMEAPALVANQHCEKLGQFIMLTQATDTDGDHAAADVADIWGRKSVHDRSLPPTGASKTAAQRLGALAAHAARQRARRAHPSQTAGHRAAALAAYAACLRARRGDQCSDDLVAEPASAPDAVADIREMCCKPRTAATSEPDVQPDVNETLPTVSEGEPSFSTAACVGTSKVSGAVLMERGQSSAAGFSHLNGNAEHAEDSSHDSAAAAGQQQEEAAEEGVSVVCMSSDEEEGIATVSKRTTQEDSPKCFDLDVAHYTTPSSRASAQQGSSALGLVMDGSGTDEELQAAEEAVVIHRDILLRAARRRNMDSDNQFPRDTSLSFISNCFKQPHGSHTAGDALAVSSQGMRPSSVMTGCFSGGKDGRYQLSTELPVAPSSPKVGQSTPRGGDATPSGVDIAPGASRATAPRPSSFLPIAGSVFDDAPGPTRAADFDDAPMPVDAVMFHDGQLISVQEEEEASPERSVEAMETGLVSEEEGGQSQLQEADQATADAISRPADTSPAVNGAGDEGEGAGVRMSLRDSPAAEEEYSQVPGDQPDEASEPEPETESAVDKAYRRIRRLWRSRANSEQPTHSHQPNPLSVGDNQRPNAEPSCLDDPGADGPADPGELEHMSGMLTRDQCTWEAMDHPQHDSSEHHAQAEEEEWARVLPQVDSAPPVTPDSPDHSSAPPNSPSWGASGGEWGPAPRAAPNSCPQSPSWDSPPRAAPNSPANACSPARLRQRTAPRAMSSSLPPRATSPDDAARHSGTQAATPMTHESTISSEKYSRGGDVVRVLDGGYACGSYAYPPPPPTPVSPSPPPSSPPHQSDTLSWRCGRYRTRMPLLDFRKSFSPQQSDTLPSKRGQLRTRNYSLEILDAFPTSPKSPVPHKQAVPNSPALVAPAGDDAQLHAEEQHEQEAVPAMPLHHLCMGARPERAAGTAANKPQQWDSPPAAEKEEDRLASGVKQAETIFGKHTPGTYEHQVQWTKSFESDEEAQYGEAETFGPGTEEEEGEGEGEGEGCAQESPSSLEECMQGAAAASSPEAVPDLQQAGQQEDLTGDSADVGQGLEKGRAVSPSPQPSPEHPLLSAPWPSSQSAVEEPPQGPHRSTPETNGHHLEETVEVALLEEEDGADGPSGAQGNEQGRPVAASGPQSEGPEVMMVDSEGEECFEDDEVQFVSETGADPSRSAFAAAVKRLAEEDDSELELFPGVQDLISGALQSRLAGHSRHSVVDDELDEGTDRSRGRGPLRRKRGCPTSRQARGSSPSQCGGQGFNSRHGRHSHSPNHQLLFCEEDEDVPPGRPVSAAAAVSAAAGSHGAGAAAAAGVSGRHARRLRDMLSVAEEEIEVDDMDADMTCWRKHLLKKPRR